VHWCTWRPDFVANPLTSLAESRDRAQHAFPSRRIYGVVLASVLFPRAVTAGPSRGVVEAAPARFRAARLPLCGPLTSRRRRSLVPRSPFAETRAAAGGDCNHPDCMDRHHRATGAPTCCAGSIFKKGSFTLQLLMWDARTGRTLSSDGKSCDICTCPTCTWRCANRVAAPLRAGIRGRGSCAGPAAARLHPTHPRT